MKPIVMLLLLALLLLPGCTANTPTQPPQLATDPSHSSTSGLPSATFLPTMPTIPTTSTTIPATEPSLPTEPQGDFLQVTYLPKTENGGITYTGLPSLPAVSYLIRDPENLQQLSVERIDHCFGVASGGKPHWITVDNQSRFEAWNTGAFAWDRISQDDRIYLTFDCGYAYGNITAQILDILEEKRIQATFFCTMTYLRSEPEVVARMILEGHHVGNHSFTHPVDSAVLTRAEMALEALAVENYLRVNFGYSSQYFRFPNGVYSENALQLLSSVGYRAVFWSLAYADWDPEQQIGAEAAFETLTSRLHPGAVILLHTTSPDNLQILADFIDYAQAQGYRFADLDEYPA